MNIQSTKEIKRLLKIPDLSPGAIFFDRLKITNGVAVIQGQPNSGKTQFILNLLADIVKSNKKAVYVSYDNVMVKLLNVVGPGKGSNVSCIRVNDLDEACEYVKDALSAKVDYVFLDDIYSYNVDSSLIGGRAQILTKYSAVYSDLCNLNNNSLTMAVSLNRSPIASNNMHQSMTPTAVSFISSYIFNIEKTGEDVGRTNLKLTMIKNRLGVSGQILEVEVKNELY
jgi:hypothetical protein